MNISKPITFKNNNLDITKIRILPPFERKVEAVSLSLPQSSPVNEYVPAPSFNPNNFVDQSRTDIFNVKGILVPDYPMMPLDVNQFRTVVKAHPL